MVVRALASCLAAAAALGACGSSSPGSPSPATVDAFANACAALSSRLQSTAARDAPALLFSEGAAATRARARLFEQGAKESAAFARESAAAIAALRTSGALAERRREVLAAIERAEAAFRAAGVTAAAHFPTAPVPSFREPPLRELHAADARVAVACSRVKPHVA